ncbi:MAG: DUF4339 domain-containing protein [Rhabdochlamydiaceae bacterium]|nr:DUF4339 domain-containing protein [Rhabdochlamydiaceae bacterium]
MEGTRLLLILAMASCGAFLAKKRKLNPFFWFAICFCLGISALVFLFFLPKIQKILKKKKKNTTTEIPVIISAPTPPLPFPIESLWYYLDEKETQKGPVSLRRLQQIWEEREIHNQTYVWTEEFHDWKKWEEIFPSRKQEGSEP